MPDSRWALEGEIMVQRWRYTQGITRVQRRSTEFLEKGNKCVSGRRRSRKSSLMSELSWGIRKGPTILVGLELDGQMSCWTISRRLNLEGVFNARAVIGKALNFEQGRDVVRLASKRITLVPEWLEDEFKRKQTGNGPLETDPVIWKRDEDVNYGSEEGNITEKYLDDKRSRISDWWVGKVPEQTERRDTYGLQIHLSSV